MVKELPVSQLQENWHGRFSLKDVEFLRAAEGENALAGIEMYLIQYPRPEVDMFETKQFE